MALSSSSRQDSPDKTSLEYEISRTVIQVPESIPDFRQKDFELMQDLGIEPRKPKWEELN